MDSAPQRGGAVGASPKGNLCKEENGTHGPPPSIPQPHHPPAGDHCTSFKSRPVLLALGKMNWLLQTAGLPFTNALPPGQMQTRGYPSASALSVIELTVPGSSQRTQLKVHDGANSDNAPYV